MITLRMFLAMQLVLLVIRFAIIRLTGDEPVWEFVGRTAHVMALVAAIAAVIAQVGNVLRTRGTEFHEWDFFVCILLGLVGLRTIAVIAIVFGGHPMAAKVIVATSVVTFSITVGGIFWAAFWRIADIPFLPHANE